VKAGSSTRSDSCGPRSSFGTRSSPSSRRRTTCTWRTPR
jgi:hypothetical protein